MWIMGYNEGGELINSSIDGVHKLRPLIPRPVLPPTATTAPPCLSRAHGITDHFFGCSNFCGGRGENKNELINTAASRVVVSSSRWNPTPEQLRSLEELYRRGTRTPSADQIQHITSQLRRYGKIEGKNVFYWFQNHKARERQKRRRRMEMESSPPLDLSGGGAYMTSYEVEQTKNWTNCSSTVAETIHNKEFVVSMESKQRQLFIKSSSTQELINRENNDHVAGESESQTLQLFPLQKEDHGMENKVTVDGSNIGGPDYQFFEFLPILKD